MSKSLRGIKTPTQHLYTREQGGKDFVYVKQGYVMSWLDEHFPDWSFQIKEKWEDSFGHVNVIGELTARTEKDLVVINAVGSKQVTLRRNTNDIVPGQYYKAAETDALKRCARYLGCANDIYFNEDLDEISIVSESDLESFYREYYSLFNQKVAEGKLQPTQVLNLIKSYMSGAITLEQVQLIRDV